MPWLQVSTVVLRGSTDNVLDDLERAVDDGVNAYKVSLPCTWHTRGTPSPCTRVPEVTCESHWGSSGSQQGWHETPMFDGVGTWSAGSFCCAGPAILRPEVSQLQVIP